MLKKSTTILLALLLLFTLTGCGSAVKTAEESLKPATTAETSAQPSDTVSAETSSSASNPDSSTAAPDPAPSPAATTTAALEHLNLAPLRIAMLKGPTAMGAVKLMTAAKNEEAGAEYYDFSLLAAVDEIAPKLLTGALDISAVPANLAAVLYNNSKGEIQVLALNTLGVLYLVENGNDIKTVSDLKGKTILASGKGATPEYVLRHLLTTQGLEVGKDVQIEWKAEHSECVAALSKSEQTIALLPQPFVTVAASKNPKIRLALDLNALWQEAGQNDSSALITGVVVGRKAFIEANPTAVADFLTAYAASVDFVQNNNAAAAEMIAACDIVPAPIAAKALPYCNIVFIRGEEMKVKLSEFLAVLYEQNPKSVGGKLPADDFYYLP